MFRPTAGRWAKAFTDVLRRRGVAEELKSATSWEDLEARLREEGLYLKKAGRGLQLTDGERTAKPSRLHRKSSLANLEQRFGERYAAYRAREPQKIPAAAARTSEGRDVPDGREMGRSEAIGPRGTSRRGSSGFGGRWGRSSAGTRSPLRIGR